MVRKVTEDMVCRWKELREKGYSFEQIGKETGGWNETVVSKYLKQPLEGEKEAELIKPDKNGWISAEAFKLFNEEVDPCNVVVKLKITAEKVKELYELWLEFPQNQNLKERNEYLQKRNDYLEKLEPEYLQEMSKELTIENENLKKLVKAYKNSLIDSEKLLDFAVKMIAQLNQELKKKKTENDDSISKMISQIENAHNNAMMMKVMKDIHGF